MKINEIILTEARLDEKIDWDKAKTNLKRAAKAAALAAGVGVAAQHGDASAQSEHYTPPGEVVEVPQNFDPTNNPIYIPPPQYIQYMPPPFPGYAPVWWRTRWVYVPIYSGVTWAVPYYRSIPTYVINFGGGHRGHHGHGGNKPDYRPRQAPAPVAAPAPVGKVGNLKPPAPPQHRR